MKTLGNEKDSSRDSLILPVIGLSITKHLSLHGKLKKGCVLDRMMASDTDV